MSINWHWSDKIGTAKFKVKGDDKDLKVNIYSGNCLAIFLNEYEDDGKTYYTLFSFWADKTHMQNILGLNKDYPGNDFNTENLILTEITFFKDKISKSDLNTILTGLYKANFDYIIINLLDTETPY